MESKIYTYLYDTCLNSVIWQKRFVAESLTDLSFPKFYFHLVNRDNERAAIVLQDCEQEYSNDLNATLKLVRECGKLRVIFAYDKENESKILSYDDDVYTFDGKQYSHDEMYAFLQEPGRELVITELVEDSEELKASTKCEDSIIHIIVLNEQGDVITSCLSDAYIQTGKKRDKYLKIEPQTGIIENNRDLAINKWDHIKQEVEHIGGYMAFFELLHFSLKITEDGPVILSVYPSLSLPDSLVPSDKLAEFIRRWNDSDANQDEKFIKLRTSRIEFNQKWTRIAEEKHRTGMRPFMASFYEEELLKDTEYKATSDEEKKWAHDRGFFSCWINHIGLNDANCDEFVSDYDYFWVNRINSDYQIWIEDKLATRYTLSEFKEKLPLHYMLIGRTNGVNRILPLHDFPRGWTLSYDTLFALARLHGCLAVKRTYGTHGIGFNKLEYRDEQYFLNGISMTSDDVVSTLFNDEGLYIVTENIEMHEWFRKFYPDALSTVRVNAFQRLNEEPVIGACFVKLTHSKGGYTDNINTSAGGIIIGLDKNDGHLHKSEFKKDNYYSDCPVHPDTQVPIEGSVPRWNEIIKGVKDICRSMPQLQFFGFDIAVTPDSFKVIEVNVFPDYTRYVLNDKETQIFLKEKVVQKYKQYRIDIPKKYLEASDLSGKVNKEYEFKFSVVMPLYNVEKYLRTAIDSLLKQELAFKENIQVILVNDGSTDGTEGICKEYLSRFPNNFKYIYQENQGVSAARNKGLAIAKGKYLTFFDGDDYWSQVAFKQVWDFFEANSDEIDVLACRKKFFEAQTGYHGLDYRFAEGNQVVDIYSKPNYIQVDVNSCFIKAECAKKGRFLEHISIAEDSRYINELILEKEKYGVISSSTYYLRKRKNETSLTQNKTSIFNQSVYTDTLTEYYEYFYDYSLKKYGVLLPYIQYLIMDAIRYRASLQIPPELSEDIKISYRSRLEKLIKRTDLDILTGLKNGSVGAKAKLLKIYNPGVFNEKLKISNVGAVTYLDRGIGKLNLRDSLIIEKISTRKFTYTIKGTILLPWFIENPSLKLVNQDNNIISDISLEISDKQDYEDMYGDAHYTRYRLKSEFRLAKNSKLHFTLVTDYAEMPINVIAKKKSNATSYIKNGVIKLRAITFEKLIKKYLRRLITN